MKNLFITREATYVPSRQFIVYSVHVNSLILFQMFTDKYRIYAKYKIMNYTFEGEAWMFRSDPHPLLQRTTVVIIIAEYTAKEDN